MHPHNSRFIPRLLLLAAWLAFVCSALAAHEIKETWNAAGLLAIAGALWVGSLLATEFF